MNQNQVNYTLSEKFSQFKSLTSSEFSNTFDNVITKLITEPRNSNNKQLANTSTPLNNRAFLFEAYTHLKKATKPKQVLLCFYQMNLTRPILVSLNLYQWQRVMGKVSPFAVFQLSQFSSPLYVTAQKPRNFKWQPFKNYSWSYQLCSTNF